MADNQPSIKIIVCPSGYGKTTAASPSIKVSTLGTSDCLILDLSTPLSYLESLADQLLITRKLIAGLVSRNKGDTAVVLVETLLQASLVTKCHENIVSLTYIIGSKRFDLENFLYIDVPKKGLVKDIYRLSDVLTAKGDVSDTFWCRFDDESWVSSFVQTFQYYLARWNLPCSVNEMNNFIKINKKEA